MNGVGFLGITPLYKYMRFHSILKKKNIVERYQEGNEANQRYRMSLLQARTRLGLINLEKTDNRWYVREVSKIRSFIINRE